MILTGAQLAGGVAGESGHAEVAQGAIDFLWNGTYLFSPGLLAAGIAAAAASLISRSYSDLARRICDRGRSRGTCTLDRHLGIRSLGSRCKHCGAGPCFPASHAHRCEIGGRSAADDTSTFDRDPHNAGYRRGEGPG